MQVAEQAESIYSMSLFELQEHELRETQEQAATTAARIRNILWPDKPLSPE